MNAASPVTRPSAGRLLRLLGATTVSDAESAVGGNGEPLSRDNAGEPEGRVGGLEGAGEPGRGDGPDGRLVGWREGTSVGDGNALITLRSRMLVLWANSWIDAE